jgi:hypothetical protein
MTVSSIADGQLWPLKPEANARGSQLLFERETPPRSSGYSKYSRLLLNWLSFVLHQKQVLTLSKSEIVSDHRIPSGVGHLNHIAQTPVRK